LAPLLEKAAGVNPDAPPGIGRAVVVNVSSILGSMSNNDNGGMYAYRCSKVTKYTFLFHVLLKSVGNQKVQV
jgi:hypothetical protein